VSGSVVGTCRLIRQEVTDRRGFYSADEFNLPPLLDRAGPCLEVGRSCVAPDYRSRAVIDRLRSGIADYIRANQVTVLFGCASLCGTSPANFAQRLSCHALTGRQPRRLARTWHRGCCTIAGLRLRVRGAPAAFGSTLLVANHVSYLDVVVLGSLVNVSFIAKAEVAGWPLIGRIGGTIFVERRGSCSAGQRDRVAVRLARGDDLILFAEGTSSDGGRVLPFKSALFAATVPGPEVATGCNR
jgi:1-acyl-sn-glycerol-3-phosphate acyltransferase